MVDVPAWHQQREETLNRNAAGTPALLDAAEAGAVHEAGRPSTGLLRIAAAVEDGETVTIGADVYEFDTDDDVVAGHIAVDVSAGAAVAAQGTLTILLQPTAGDTFTIGDKVFTFVDVDDDDADGEVTVGANVAAARLAIVAAINGTDGHNEPHPLVTAAAFVVADSVITANTPGTNGNAIATTETFTDVGSGFDAATLGTTTAGADSTGAEGVTALIAAINESGTENVLATAASANSIEVVTADAPGGAAVASTDTLATTETMGGANNAWAAVTLTAGVLNATRQHAVVVHTVTATEDGLNVAALAFPFDVDAVVIVHRTAVGGGVTPAGYTTVIEGGVVTYAGALAAGEVLTVEAWGA